MESLINPQLEMPLRESILAHDIGLVMQRLGLSRKAGRIYLLLSRMGGPLAAREISEILAIHMAETRHLLSSLQDRGFVNATFAPPIEYVAEPLEKSLPSQRG